MGSGWWWMVVAVPHPKLDKLVVLSETSSASSDKVSWIDNSHRVTSSHIFLRPRPWRDPPGDTFPSHPELLAAMPAVSAMIPMDSHEFPWIPSILRVKGAISIRCRDSVVPQGQENRQCWAVSKPKVRSTQVFQHLHFRTKGFSNILL